MCNQSDTSLTPTRLPGAGRCLVPPGSTSLPLNNRQAGDGPYRCSRRDKAFLSKNRDMTQRNSISTETQLSNDSQTAFLSLCFFSVCYPHLHTGEEPSVCNQSGTSLTPTRLPGAGSCLVPPGSTSLPLNTRQDSTPLPGQNDFFFFSPRGVDQSRRYCNTAIVQIISLISLSPHGGRIRY